MTTVTEARARLGPCGPASRRAASAISAIRTSASARRRGGVRPSSSDGGSVSAWSALTTVSAALEDRLPLRIVRPAYVVEMLRPS